MLATPWSQLTSHKEPSMTRIGATVLSLLLLAGAVSNALAEPTPIPQTGTRAYVFSDAAVSARRICEGYATMTLPLLGACPMGSIGIATCTQRSRVPRKLTLDTGADGAGLDFACELDFANAEPLGPVECDYSRCFAVSDPVIFGAHFEGRVLDEIGPGR
jgi:hypothetical protein